MRHSLRAEGPGQVGTSCTLNGADDLEGQDGRTGRGVDGKPFFPVWQGRGAAGVPGTFIGGCSWRAPVARLPDEAWRKHRPCIRGSEEKKGDGRLSDRTAFEGGPFRERA